MKITYLKDKKGENLREHSEAVLWKGSNPKFFESARAGLLNGLFALPSRANRSMVNIVNVSNEAVKPTNPTAKVNTNDVKEFYRLAVKLGVKLG